MPTNDPPRIASIMDVVMEEDTEYTSQIDFVETYINDIDSDMEDVMIEFFPTDPAVHVTLTDEGYLHVELDNNFNGVVPVTVEVADSEGASSATFKVKVSVAELSPSHGL